MIYKEKFKLGLKDIGKNNKIKNRAILECLENIGAYHSDIAGYGANDAKRTKVSWILLEWDLKVIERPTYGDEIEIHTWARGINKFFTYRDYEIYNNNKLCAIATSKWALINIETGKLFRLTEEIINSYKPEEKHVFPSKNIEKIEIPDDFEKMLEYTVVRRDIDLNKHMHNLYYLDLAYETLPEEIYAKRPFDNVRITYKKEIKLGDCICCEYAKKDDRNIVEIKSKDDKILHAVIELY